MVPRLGSKPPSRLTMALLRRSRGIPTPSRSVFGRGGSTCQHLMFEIRGQCVPEFLGLGILHPSDLNHASRVASVTTLVFTVTTSMLD